MKFSFFSFLFSPLGIDIILTDFLFLHWNWACPTFHNISHIKLWKGSFFIDKTNDLIHERDIISNTFFFLYARKKHNMGNCFCMTNHLCQWLLFHMVQQTNIQRNQSFFFFLLWYNCSKYDHQSRFYWLNTIYLEGIKWSKMIWTNNQGQRYHLGAY